VVARLKGRAIALVLFPALLGIVGAGLAAPIFPQLTGPVVDQASIIEDSSEAQLDRKLRAFQQESGAQIVVATVPDLQGYDIRDFGNRLFRHWQLGDEKRNDGVLLLVAVADRKMSIEVGYGLEPTLTDAISKIIIEYSITPRFRRQDYAGGIAEGVHQVMRVLKGEGQTVVAEVPQAEGMDPVMIWIILLFMLLTLWIIYRGLRGGGIVPADRGGRGWSSGSWGRGGGWSGGGGYSGGGGSSGGGGASGGW
jgi:uncharacterized protein